MCVGSVSALHGFLAWKTVLYLGMLSLLFRLGLNVSLDDSVPVTI